MHVNLFVYFAGSGGLYDQDYVQKRLDRADNVEESGKKLSGTLHPSGSNDMSILAMQRLYDQYVHKLLNSSPFCPK
jgi:hypothetical protein